LANGRVNCVPRQEQTRPSMNTHERYNKAERWHHPLFTKGPRSPTRASAERAPESPPAGRVSLDVPWRYVQDPVSPSGDGKHCREQVGQASRGRRAIAHLLCHRTYRCRRNAVCRLDYSAPARLSTFSPHSGHASPHISEAWRPARRSPVTVLTAQSGCTGYCTHVLPNTRADRTALRTCQELYL
jgi:hypothetical protein